VKRFYTCFFSCQVENTLSFAFILRANYGRIVENFLLKLWKILWKTSQVFSIRHLKIQVILITRDMACVKVSKLCAKKKIKSKKN